jgi:hypothetical protein
VSTARRPATHHHLLPNRLALCRSRRNTTIEQIASALIAKQATVDAAALADAIADVVEFVGFFGELL